MVSVSALHTAPRFVLFEDPDGQTGLAVYRLGRWRGIDRWRAYILHRRRSKRPYLEVPGSKIRIPIQIMSEVA